MKHYISMDIIPMEIQTVMLKFHISVYFWTKVYIITERYLFIVSLGKNILSH